MSIHRNIEPLHSWGSLLTEEELAGINYAMEGVSRFEGAEGDIMRVVQSRKPWRPGGAAATGFTFTAIIEASTPFGANMWVYAPWREVVLVTNGYSASHWETPENGRTSGDGGPARNYSEIETSTEIHGSGITYDEIPLGFEIRPANGVEGMNSIFVTMEEKRVGNGLAYWFRVNNTIGGSCPVF